MRIWLVIAVVTLLVAVGAVALRTAPEQPVSWATGAQASLEPSLPPAKPSYKLSAHETLSRVILQLREDYVDPRRVKPYDMFLGALNNIQKTVPEVRVDDQDAPRRLVVSVADKSQEFEPGRLDKLWEVTMALRDIFRFLQRHIPDPEVCKEVEFAAINGMLSTLDPHSILLDPESFAEVKMSTSGEFGGLGIVISVRDSHLTVVAPIDDTPAARVGIRANDKIVRIGDESAANMTLEEAITRLRGERGSMVKLWILRKGWGRPRVFDLERDNIKIESVASKLLAGGVGYIKIKSFQKNTFEDLQSALAALKKRNREPLKGLVLDLRNNPGGLLEQAALIADRFVKSGPLVITVGWGNKRREVKEAHAEGTDDAYPVAVLINGGSASASEIVSGALKNHDRAVLIGQNTFGKGSVQLLYDLKKSRAALKLTIAQYLIPGDESIQSVGIMPDIEAVPVVINKDRLQVFSEYSGLRERDLEQHLEQHEGATPSAGNAAVAAVTRLVHLVEEETEESAMAHSTQKFRSDFEIELGREVLLAAGTGDRLELLDRSKELLESRRQEQYIRLEAAFARLGLDWRGGERTLAPQVEIYFDLPKNVFAGQTVEMTASVKNVGEGPLFRVYGLTRSSNPLFDRREFAFGYLAPGEAREWTVKVDLPVDLDSGGDQIRFQLGDEHHSLDSPTTLRFISIEALRRPRFSYLVRINDIGVGNGDGVLQPGEQAKLSIRIGNVSDVDAEEVVVSSRSVDKERLRVEGGRVALKRIPAHGFKTATMTVKVGDVDITQQPATLDFKVRVWDNRLGALLSGKIKLPLSSATTVVPGRQALRVNKSLGVLAGAHEKTMVLATATRGAFLSATARVGPYWRVKLSADTHGYVRRADVKVVRTQVRAKQPIELLVGQQAPRLSLWTGLLVVDSAEAEIHGDVLSDRSMRDLFVFVNERKILYRALKPGSVKHPFEFNLPLQPGENRINVIARENEDSRANRSFSIYRRTAGETRD